jgi:hypothetical protein
MTRRHLAMSLLFLVVVAALGRTVAKAAEPPTTRLIKVSLDLPSPEVVRVTLHGAPLPGGVPSGVASQRVTLGGDVAIPIEGAVALVGDAASTNASFDLRLREVPERVLSLDPNRLAVRWEGLDAKGTAVVAVAGTPDLGDPGDAELPLRKLYDAYARLAQVDVTPGLTSVHVRSSLSLLNPLGFDIAVVRAVATLRVGTQTVLTVQRPGFRLRAGQRSEVPIEQDVALADMAGGMAGLLRGDPAGLDGTLVIHTAQGDREVPLHLGAAPRN